MNMKHNLKAADHMKRNMKLFKEQKSIAVHVTSQWEYQLELNKNAASIRRERTVSIMYEKQKQEKVVCDIYFSSQTFTANDKVGLNELLLI